MATTREDLKRWFENGVSEGATHMMVMCDTFDWDDYPVYVKAGEDVKEEVKKRDGKDMQKLMEVYDLRKQMKDQIETDKRQFNY